MDKEDARAPNVAIFPSPGMGHLVPLLKLASTLHHRHNLSVTLLVDQCHRDEPLLGSLPASVSVNLLPYVSLDDLPDSSKHETRICASIARNLPVIRSFLSDLKSSRSLRLVALVVDLFTSGAIDVARELNIFAYIFFTSSATNLSAVLHLPILDAEFSCEYRDLPHLLRLPGCVPLHGRDLADTIQDRGNDCYRLFLGLSRKYNEVDGIMVNSFAGIEPGPCQALQHDTGRPPVFPVGPIIKDISPTGDSTGCLQWLDRQPPESVLYVSFGSGGVLSNEQTGELAAGLEMSQQRFLWVVRTPRKGPADADFFGIRDDVDPMAFLPEGFLERTKGLGFVVPNWAPQVQVLGHVATGGFLSHCGWNSTLESMVHGVPMAAWPLYAEQRCNAVVLVSDARVAIRVEGTGSGALVTREEVSRVAKELMEGDRGMEVRKRARRVKEVAKAVLAEDGESTRALAAVANRWKAGTGG